MLRVERVSTDIARQTDTEKESRDNLESTNDDQSSGIGTTVGTADGTTDEQEGLAQKQPKSSPFASTSAPEGKEDEKEEANEELPLAPSSSRASVLQESDTAAPRSTTDVVPTVTTVLPDTFPESEAIQDQGQKPEPPSSDDLPLPSGGSQPPATPPPAAPAVPSGATQSEAAVHAGLVARDFLESNPSQLTVYGLSALMDGMSDQQLAVFFRNNHFNVLLRSGSGLYILVTDQGYLYESDVMWEHLSNVDGDTELLGWDLKPFRPHSGSAEEAIPALIADEAALIYSGDGEGVLSTAGGTEHAQHADADFALAMQLQQEEEERVRLAEERRRVEALRRQELRPGAGGGGGGSAASGRQQAGQGQGRPGSSGKKKKKSPDCSIM